MWNFSLWFVQLWSESLGKIDKSGEASGLTAIPAYGATDQHSQMQLFMEGPTDKCLIFIKVEDFENNFKLKSNLKCSVTQKLSNFSLSDLFHAEYAGTKKALTEKKKPQIHITIDRLDAHHLGELILFFESLTVLVGQLINVDPFNQPGVELGKRYALNWLDQKGS